MNICDEYVIDFLGVYCLSFTNSLLLSASPMGHTVFTQGEKPWVEAVIVFAMGYFVLYQGEYTTLILTFI